MQDAIGFDNEKYLQEQSAAILDRARRFGNKLYLEFGGKLLFDYHAARVLPGFDPNVKIRLLAKLKEEAEILLCIHAGAIERKKMRADFGITYDADAMKLIDDLRDWGIELRGVVITRFDEQPGAAQRQAELVELLAEHVGARQLDRLARHVAVLLGHQRAPLVGLVRLIPVGEVEVVHEVGLRALEAHLVDTG